MSTSKTAKHTLMVAFWQKHIANRKRTGLTVKAYCEENNLTVGRYYYWHRVIQNECIEVSSSDEVSLPTPSNEERSFDPEQNSPAPEFVEVHLPSAVTTPSRDFTIPSKVTPAIHPLVLTLPNGITIAIQDTSSASLLSGVLCSLRKAGLT